MSCGSSEYRMRPSFDQIFTRTTDGLRTWPTTRASSLASASRSPCRTPSPRPADSTSRPCTCTWSRVLRSASLIVTERSAKNAPTTTTMIATSVPSMNRATAGTMRGEGSPTMPPSSRTRGPGAHPTYVALRSRPARIESLGHEQHPHPHPHRRRRRRSARADDGPRQAWWRRRRQRPWELHEVLVVEAQAQRRRRPHRDRVRGRPEPQRRALARHADPQRQARRVDPRDHPRAERLVRDPPAASPRPPPPPHRRPRRPRRVVPPHHEPLGRDLPQTSFAVSAMPPPTVKPVHDKPTAHPRP